jgi:hypothetical protein
MKCNDIAVGNSRSSSDNGRTAGTSVWCLKGTTLKWIRTATT